MATSLGDGTFEFVAPTDSRYPLVEAPEALSCDLKLDSDAIREVGFELVYKAGLGPTCPRPPLSGSCWAEQVSNSSPSFLSQGSPHHTRQSHSPASLHSPSSPIRTASSPASPTW